MYDGVDEVKAWKDSDAAEGTEHPAGEVRLPKYRGQVVRAMALAGMVIGLSGVVAQAGIAITGTTSAP